MDISINRTPAPHRDCLAYGPYECSSGLPELTQRLRSIFGMVDVGNGTEVADALASALTIDRRMSPHADAAVRLRELSPPEIVAAAVTLQMTLRKQGWGFALPLGTSARPALPGSIRIGNETWALVAGVPGLHPIRALPHDAHGPNLELLRKHIHRMTRNLACRRLGLPTPVTVADGGVFDLLRFAPLPDAGDVILERRVYGTGAERFCSALPGQIVAFAVSIVRDMRFLWKRRRSICSRVNAVRTEATTVAASFGATLSAIAIDLEHQHDASRFAVTVDLLATDEAMRPGIVRKALRSCHPPKGLDLSRLGLASRAERRTNLAAVGADGRIDELAIIIARAAPEGPVAVLRRLATAYDTTVSVPSVHAPTFATLFWRDGLITTELATDLLYWEGRNLELHGVVPDSIIACLPGRRLSDLIELPFACDSVISEARCGPYGMVVQLEARSHYVDCRTGRIWIAPGNK